MGPEHREPQVLYKYLKREHALRWLSKGEVRIGVLSVYRDTERYGEEIGDPDEGTRVLWEAPDVVDSESPEPSLAKQVLRIGPGRHIQFHGVRFEHRQLSPDYYVLCFSGEFSEEAMRKMNPAYDACVRIDNPRAFLHAVTAELHRFRISSKLVGAQWCVYRDREIHVSEEAAKVPVALIKDSRYAYQREVRAVWEPRRREVPLMARNVYSLAAARFCSPYYNCG